MSKFFYGAHGRSSIDCFSRAFLPSLSRAAFSVCRSGRDHIFFFSLTLNIALKSTAPRRVRQEPDEPPELSATTIVFCVDKKMKEEEKQKWFFFSTSIFSISCLQKGHILSLYSLSSLLSPLSKRASEEHPSMISFSTRSHRQREAPRSHTCSPSPQPQTPQPPLHRRRRSQTVPFRASTRALPR